MFLTWEGIEVASKRRIAPEETGVTQQPGIEAITIKGFKSLAEETRIEIRPLTILAGANSSGKSSAMQPLLLVKQTLEASYDPGTFLLDGPNVSFTSDEQFWSLRPNGVERQMSLAFTVAQDTTEVTYERRPGDLLTVTRLASTQDQVAVSRRTDLPPTYAVAATSSKTQSLYEACQITQERCFLGFKGTFIELFRILRGTEPGDDSPRFEVEVALGSITTIKDACAELIHLPGLRGNPRRTYPTSSVQGHFAGTFDKYAASIIAHWQESGASAEHKSLERYLLTLGLTDRIEAHRVNQAEIELRVARQLGSPSGADLVSIADVGIGVSQVLPVLVALLTANAGQLVYIEQPEIHLHPRAQVAMAGILAEAAMRGVRVIIETHSSLVLRGIQIAVREGGLKADLTQLHWFTRDASGFTKVESGELDVQGRFGEWPVDFDDVTMETDSRYLGLR